jgi:hypothetical protein
MYRQTADRRVGRERAPGVLVHPDGDRHVALAVLDGPGGHGQGAARGGAAVEHAAQRNPGQPQPADDRVRVGYLEAADEPRLDLGPADAGVGEREPDRVGGHVHRGFAREPAERVQPDSDDGRFHHSSSSPAGANANVMTSVPSAWVA